MDTRNRNFLLFANTWGHPGILLGFVLLIILFFCVFYFLFCLSSVCVLWPFLSVSMDSPFSLLRQISSYFQRCEIFLSCTNARQKNHVRFTGKCMLYSLCQLATPPYQFSMPFLFKINNSLYIVYKFTSFINTQILTISLIYYIITFTQYTCLIDMKGK